MKKIRNGFERFCYTNRNKGLPNLMLYIMVANAIVYIMGILDNSPALYLNLCFDRNLILQGQVWRLITFVFTAFSPYENILLVLISALCYYWLGKATEQAWGTLRFNLFYLTGVVLMVIYAMIFNCFANPYYLNLSLLLSFATLYPSSQFYLFFIIPIRAWVLAALDLVLVLFDVFTGTLPGNLFPLVSLANYFLFFGKDVANIIPLSWRMKLRGMFRKKAKPAPDQPIPFRTAQAAKPTQKPAYTHRCTVCGRTDVSNPELEFRYCSRCQGYFCYCEDHINNHTHVQ